MLFRKHIILVFTILLISPCVWAEELSHIWSQRFGDTSLQQGMDIAVDTLGDVVITGRFQGMLNLGGANLNSVGSWDIYVAKFDPNGNHIWSKRFGDASSQGGFNVAVDVSRNIIVTGYLSGSVDFGGGQLTSAGSDDIFLVKFDPNGNHIWSKRFGDSYAQAAYGIALDVAGNIVIAGLGKGTVDFGGGPLTGAGGNDMLLAKFDPNGNHIWSSRFGDASHQQLWEVAVDGIGNIVIAGNSQGTVDFGGGPLTGAGYWDVVVAKFDPDGNHIWSKRFDSASDQSCQGLAVDGLDNIVFTGPMKGSVDFGGGPITSAGDWDIYLVKLDLNGTHLYSQRFGDGQFQETRDCFVDGSGNIIITGNFQGSVDFGGGWLTSAGAYDILMAIINPSGSHLWSQRFGSASGYWQVGEHMAGTGKNLYLTGWFESTVDFGGGVLSSNGGYDIFLVNFENINTSEGNDVIVQPVDETSGEAPVILTFDSVTVAGVTSLSITETGPPPPAGFKLGSPPTYYELTTTAQFTDSIEICIDYSTLSFVSEKNLKFQHYEYGHWEDRTVSLDTLSNIICAKVTSFSTFAIFELTIGSVVGHVTADCLEPGMDFAGVEIDAYLQGTGDLLGTGITSADGYYQIDSLEAGAYMMTIVTPVSYAAVEDEIPTTVLAGELATADFSLICLDITPSQRSIGFWKHQVGVANGGNGNSQIDGETLCDYLDLIEMHFNNNTINEVKVYVPPGSGLCSDKLEEAKDLLNLKGNVAMTDRAKQQLMALLLNVASEKLSLREVISVDGANVSQAITHCDSLIDDSMGDHEKAKTICDWINNSTEVPAGVIPLDTRDIPYSPPRGDDGLPEVFALGQNYPNPFNPSTVISYDVPASGGKVTLWIYDVEGRLVRTLVNEYQFPGQKMVTWYGRDNDGQSVATGVYFYRMTAPGFEMTKKMILLK